MNYLCLLANFTLFLSADTYLLPSCMKACPNATQPKCPCVKPPGSGKCMQYDTRLLATSIDEALFSFPNLAVMSDRPMFDPAQERGGGGGDRVDSAPEMGMGILAAAKTVSASTFTATAPDSPTSTSYGCRSKECSACKLKIIDGFLQNGGVDTSMAEERQTLQSKLGEKDTCTRDGSGGNAPTPSATDSTTEQMMRLLSGEGGGGGGGGDWQGNEVHRLRRDSNNITDDTAAKEKLLGIATQLGCDYRRGAQLSKSGRWTGLCNICWQWRRLPDDYFPTYLNEVTCDEKDCGCLAGFGTCRPVLRTLSVLRKNPNTSGTSESDWQPATVETVAACECQVEIGTPLHALAAK